MTEIARKKPFTPVRTLRNELDRIFGDFLPWDEGNSELLSTVWSPRTDFSETDQAYLVRMDLPGIEKENISVGIEENRLIVRGERKEEEKIEGENFHRLERRSGNFFRSMSLPLAVKEGKIKATFNNGVLTINIPKAKETKPVEIEIM